MDRYYLTKGQMLRSDDDDLVSGFAEPNWHPGLPPQPDGFPWDATFQLRPADSEYLRGRILCRAGSSLLAHLVRQSSPPATTPFAWDSDFYGGFPEEIKRCVDHSRCFSEAIHGAALLYNLMLAELARRPDAIEEYRNDIGTWADMIESRQRTLSEWDHDQFWRILDQAEARIPSRTRQFVMHWLGRALSMPDLRGVADDHDLRNLIHNRERMLKRGQARLDNPRALELWSGAAGTGRLDYRWGVSRGILTDILEGFDNA
jgi:hypothetical protein